MPFHLSSWGQRLGVQGSGDDQLAWDSETCTSLSPGLATEKVSMSGGTVVRLPAVSYVCQLVNGHRALDLRGCHVASRPATGSPVLPCTVRLAAMVLLIGLLSHTYIPLPCLSTIRGSHALSP